MRMQDRQVQHTKLRSAETVKLLGECSRESESGEEEGQVGKEGRHSRPSMLSIPVIKLQIDRLHLTPPAVRPLRTADGRRGTVGRVGPSQ